VKIWRLRNYRRSMVCMQPRSVRGSVQQSRTWRQRLDDEDTTLIRPARLI